MHRRDFVKQLVLGAGLSALPLTLKRALACQEWSSSDIHETLWPPDLFSVPGWAEGSFVGQTHRVVRQDPPRLLCEVDATAGAMDTALRGYYTLADVANTSFLNSNYYIEATYGIHEVQAGTGQWWVGPKFSINFAGFGVGPGWYECYVIEKSNRDQTTWAEVLGSFGFVAIGTTNHNGATYRHYRGTWGVAPDTWTQFFAVRERYRRGGPVSIPPIILHWLANGLASGIPLDEPRINIEHSGEGHRIFKIKDVHLPPSYI